MHKWPETETEAEAEAETVYAMYLYAVQISGLANSQIKPNCRGKPSCLYT